MSLVVAPFGSSNDVVVPASGIVTAFSRGAFSVQVQNNPNANVPPVWSILAQVPANTVYTSSAFTAGAVIRIDASGGQEVGFDVGTSPGVKLGRAVVAQAVSVSASNTASTLTMANIIGGIITSSGSAIALTLPTGAVADAASSFDNGEGVFWSLISTAGTVTVTAAASGHTVVGAGAVLTGITGRFCTVKTAASTFVTYRVG